MESTATEAAANGTARKPHPYKLQLSIEGEAYDVRHRCGRWDLRKWDGTIYTVSSAAEGDACHCTCDAFKYSKGHAKHCKHTAACSDRGLI